MADAVKLILTANRVVRGMTIDPNYKAAEGETLVDVGATPPDIKGGYVVLADDGVTLLPATAEQVDIAGVDPAKEAVKQKIRRVETASALKDLIEVANADATPLGIALARYFGSL